MPSIAPFRLRIRPVLLAPLLALVSTIAAPAAARDAVAQSRGAQSRGAQDGTAPGGGAAERVVRRLAFEGNEAVADVTLANAITTTNSSWFARVAPFSWLGLGEKRYFDEQQFRADVEKLRVTYKAVGYPDVQIDTVVRRAPESVYITFHIREGKPIRLTAFEVTGIDSLPAWQRRLTLRDLPLERGDVFNRFAMTATADSIQHRLQDRGFPGAQVFSSFQTDRAAYTASTTLDVYPGTRAYVNRVRVVGTNRVDSSVVRGLMVARPGRRFSTGEILESQQSLYRSDLFNYVLVGVDSAAYTAGGDSVPLVVQVREGRPRRIRGSLGFATNDCFRGSLGWTSRNFLGGGRILDLSSRLSKVGVGEPLDWGLAEGICGDVADDEVGSARVNFGLTAAVRRPGFLSPYNTIATSVYTERRSEFKVYLRRETGAGVAFTREAARRRIPLSLAYTLAYGHTEATAANFCAFFNACAPDVLDVLRQDRVLATLSGTVAMPRVNNPINPTRGSLKTLEVIHSSRFIGSSRLQQFTRVVADAAWYRSLRRDVVLSWRVRAGAIFAPRLNVATESGAFIPPEHRFYAGGPNDVRGFERNELGPVVYVVPKTHFDSVAVLLGQPIDSLDPNRVRVAAAGGNTLAVGNVELRFPSPVFSSRLRLAAFVDAGTLWRRQDSIPQVLRVTPGIGLRVETPLGPARLDFAYNPYRLQPGTLLQVDNRPEPVGTGTLTPVEGQDSYVLDRRRKLTVHFAVGQPF